MVTADQLVKEQKDRENKKKKNFKKVYKLVERRIIDSSKINLYQCIYDIPNFLLNGPLYSLDECREYILNKLKSNGFQTMVITENRILIRWNST